MFKNTSIVLISSILLFGCGDVPVVKRSSSASYHQVKQTLEQKEKNNPQNFLEVNGTYKKNLIGEWVIEGNITNTASVANYKDIVLDIHFYSKTNSHINTKRKTIYEFIAPGRSKPFKLKLPANRDAKQLNWQLVNALGV